MKIFSGRLIREWDAFSIKHQGIRSIELMERAVAKVYDWIDHHFQNRHHFYIVCGKGNNGGDGLALARMLLTAGKDVRVYILETGREGSPDFTENLHRLHSYNAQIVFCQTAASFPTPPEDALLIDALFGTGLNKPPAGLALELINHLQKFQGITIAIDLPSGLFADSAADPKHVLPATHTLSFQSYKQSLLIDDNATLAGKVHILDIGLSPRFQQENDSPIETIGEEMIHSIIQQRNPYGHKGTFGHACIIAGKGGMMGAAVLAARACMASGVGKTTLGIPESQFQILQISAPEVICMASGSNCFDHQVSLHSFQAVAIGPGIGTDQPTRDALKQSLQNVEAPLVLDADALNCLTAEDFFSLKRNHYLITPHPLEFDRLFGKHKDGFSRFQATLNIAEKSGSYILLKGHYTAVFTPKGKVYININGNDGMAKGGAGDLLTGFIAGLMAQGYSLPESAILGVFLHGLAGDLAAVKYSRHSMQPSHILECFTDAWKKFE